MKKSLITAKEIILDILFPPLCIRCNKTLISSEKTRAICDNCLVSIPKTDTLTCPKCNARLAENKKVCHKDIPYRLAAASFYGDEVMRNIIWQLKYENRTYATRPLAHLIAENLREIGLNLSNYTVIPIPLHRARERSRGFNQSALIAEHVSRSFYLPYEHRALIRKKPTKPQAEAKDLVARKENMENAFYVKRPERIASKNILLIDDVFTSGATIEAAARTLRAAGSRKIIAAVAAKAR